MWTHFGHICSERGIIEAGRDLVEVVSEHVLQALTFACATTASHAAVWRRS
jgi:hypothetical protein